MTDMVDRAQALEQRHRDKAFKRLVPRPQEPSEYCVDCGVWIDEKRREAVPETDRCTDCQNDKEKQNAIR